MPTGRLLANEFRSKPDSLFHDPRFFQLHASSEACFFEWELDGHPVGAIHFDHVGNGHWRSPAKGTFAGYWCGPACPLEELARFHDRVEQCLVEKGAQRIEVLPHPQAYDPVAFARMVYLLLSNGFRPTQADLTQGLEVTQAAFRSFINHGNVGKLRKAQREGVTASPLPIAKLAEVVALLESSRAAKGYSLSMNMASLEQLSDAFPDRVVLFGASLGDRLIASALCLRVWPQVLYIFYWGHDPDYNSLSPLVSLAEVIYAYCQENDVRLLDLGTSTVGSEPNYGLLQFKRGLGFEESLKLRLTKTIS